MVWCDAIHIDVVHDPALGKLDARRVEGIGNVLIQHQQDKYCITCCDPCFTPEVLEKRSVWKNQLANIAFNYDITPTISLGFLWQAPLMQLFTYRNTTLMFGLNVVF